MEVTRYYTEVLYDRPRRLEPETSHVVIKYADHEAAMTEKDKELKAAKRLIQNMANDYHKLMAQAFLAKGE